MNAPMHVEWWKLRRAPVALTTTALLALVVPAIALTFHMVAQDGGAGLVAQKADLLLVGDGWDGYLTAVQQVAATAVFLGTGVLVAWSFGREHTDRTFSALFALPTPRRSIAVAKSAVLAAWAVILAAVMTVTTTGVGLLADIGAFHLASVGPTLLRLFAVVLAAGLLGLPVAIAANIGRGHLPGVGATILLVTAAQVSVLLGVGGWFPFAVPGLLAAAGSPGAPALTTAQVLLVPATSGLGVWLTVRWWRTAEIT